MYFYIVILSEVEQRTEVIFILRRLTKVPNVEGASMVIIGIDFGNHSCVVTAVVKGKLTTLANDSNQRKTP